MKRIPHTQTLKELAYISFIVVCAAVIVLRIIGEILIRSGVLE